MPELIKIDVAKLKPNERCHCGSGQKFKYCHGRKFGPRLFNPAFVNVTKYKRNDPCWCGRKDSNGKSVKYKKCHFLGPRKQSEFIVTEPLLPSGKDIIVDGGRN